MASLEVITHAESQEAYQPDIHGGTDYVYQGGDVEKGIDDYVEKIDPDEETGTVIEDPNLDTEQPSLEDDSPYPEVRSAVANTDDPTMPVATLRAWFLGLVFAIVIPGMNQFFFFRYPSVTIAGLVSQLISYPIGRALAATLPNYTLFGMSLNPGPFTIKEHVLVTVMSNVSSGSAYASDIIAVQRVYYNQNPSFLYQWFVVMSTQLIGFSIGGIAKRFLVQPPSMIWPANLVQCALFNTLHSQQYAGAGNAHPGMSRERFFLYVFVPATLWYFFPGWLWTGLSTFAWVTWIAPNNVKINQLFGYYHGLGMSVVTFDWNQIAYIGSPLATPWWASANVAGAVLFFYWFLTPILYYTNTWYSAFLPMTDSHSYDNTGAEYDVERILKPDGTFDFAAYKSYSPLFLPTTFALSYGLSFASMTATLVHAFLYFRKQIWEQTRRSLHEQPDIHARLMSVYRTVPEWWYACMFACMFAVSLVSIELWKTHLPVWAFVLSLLIPFVYVLPIGMIQAITNQQVGLNVITEVIVGYALPGRPLAMMLFKTWGYISMSQGLGFVSDLKLGHYMKIPPRTMFWCQVVATAVAGTVQLGVQSWMFSNIEDICQAHQRDGFTCPNTKVFGTASIIWGVIGPKLQFSTGQIYGNLMWFFLLGAIAPVIPWALARRWPTLPLKYINFPVIFSGTGLIPPATPINYIPWAIVGFVFQYLIRRRRFSWWAKYNYVLSAALDSGAAVGALLVFFCLQYPLNNSIGAGNVQQWWGNTVMTKTADYLGTPLKVLAKGQTFGPASW